MNSTQKHYLRPALTARTSTAKQLPSKPPAKHPVKKIFKSEGQKENGKGRKAVEVKVRAVFRVDSGVRRWKNKAPRVQNGKGKYTEEGARASCQRLKCHPQNNAKSIQTQALQEYYDDEDAQKEKLPSLYGFR
eukprot:TRINITY_DN15120_c0_g1_i1.p1 TRINITY_DN15120_c0_g1~~TRINITY_DN15120_c0_g1_i1.p1  ORF type:complete len:133 (+),score=12.95 TRINITY_DN15120_c0_g1_i1:83-481(+)